MAKCCIPGCEETENLYAICERGTDCYDDDDDNLTGKYICEKHLKLSELYDTEEDNGYARCSVCAVSSGVDIAYNMADLNNIEGIWYCDEHKSEALGDD
jgi:hypothetical protein